MAITQIRGYTQILTETIRNSQIAQKNLDNIGIQTSKLEDGAKIFFTDGTRPMTANLDMGSAGANQYRIINLAPGISDTDAVTKGQLDAVVTGLDVKASVRYAETVSNIDLASYTPSTTIDSHTIADGDRVILIAQTDPKENGIYQRSGTSLVRATDADNTPGGEVTSGMFTFVEEGSNAQAGFVLQTANPITLGTTNLSFVQFSGAGQITAGSGLTKIGNTISVDSGHGIYFDGNKVAVKVSDITDTQKGLETNETTRKIQIHLDDNSGLKFNSASTYGLMINLATSSGMQIGAGGELSVIPTIAGEGLSWDAVNGKLDLSLSANGGLDIISDELSVDVTDLFDPNYGLVEDSNKLRISLESDGGIQFDPATHGLEIKLTTNSGLTVDSNGLKISTDFAGHGLSMTNGILNVDLVVNKVVSPSPDDTTVTFTVDLANPFAGGTEQVYLNGLLQVAGDDYTLVGNEVSGYTGITFASAPKSGDRIRVTYLKF